MIKVIMTIKAIECHYYFVFLYIEKYENGVFIY